ncbi:hypothetical protein PGT21_020925 [Puccinia graminis f. sp. tritici]|uniref:Uncharacterized protein n=1 Tax=Puccinia graminis f. sp. tritici TaxID=56615 RepID=A0A5B0RIF7_PUCGR|nr:hypothetical protein PGT21_020925 [Puccinia graminis f. sp. tritici]KAA1124554.1 hypothetical protein PGTUg99_014947 [Puccinia graminis f. sp. tritici]
MMLTLQSMVLATLIAKVWAGTFLCDNRHPLFLDDIVLDSQAPQGVGTVILTRLDGDSGKIVSDSQQRIEFRNELKVKLWVYDGNKKGEFVEFSPNGVAQLQLIKEQRLWVATMERPFKMLIPLYKEMTEHLLIALNEDRFILQEPTLKFKEHQEAMAHLNKKGLINSQPKMGRNWEYPPQKNPSDVRPITVIRDWDKKLIKEVQYSGKLWWIIHPHFISTSEDSTGIPFHITRGGIPWRSDGRIIKNIQAKAKPSIMVHVGDFSSVLTSIGAGEESSILFNKPGNWAVITLFDQAAPLTNDVYKLLTSWNNDQMKNIKWEEAEAKEEIPLSWKESIQHSCNMLFEQEGSGYELTGKLKID